MSEKLEVLKRPGKSAADFFAKKDQVRILASDVWIWFKAAGTARLTIPDTEMCERVANRINGIVGLGKPIAYPVSRETAKYFKLALYHVRKDRNIVATAGCTGKMPFEASPEAMQAFDDAIAAAESALQPFLVRARDDGSGQEFCQSVAAVARAAWRLSGREPRDFAPSSPIVSFVVLAATGCGFKYDAECVSAWLRRRSIQQV